MRHIRSCALLAALLPLLASGCAGGGQYGAQRTNVRYYGDCYQPIADLRASENTVLTSTAGGAALGAAAGALLGLLAADRHHRGRGAAIGAIAGALAGGVAGNIHGRQQKIADENRRMAAYLEELEGDISGLDIVSSSSRASLQCYDRRFDQLTEAMRARRISRGEAAERFHEIRTGREEAIAIMGKAERRGHELAQQYETAFHEEERALGGPLDEEDDPMFGAESGEWHDPDAWQEEERWESPRQGQVTTAQARKSVKAKQARQARAVQARQQARAAQAKTAKATTHKATTRSTDSAKRRQARTALAQAKRKKAALNRQVSKISEARQEAQTKSRADSKKMEQMMAVIDA